MMFAGRNCSYSSLFCAATSVNSVRSADPGRQDKRAKLNESTADDLALRGQLEAFVGNSDLASKLCHEAKR